MGIHNHSYWTVVVDCLCSPMDSQLFSSSLLERKALSLWVSLILFIVSVLCLAHLCGLLHTAWGQKLSLTISQCLAIIERLRAWPFDQGERLVRGCIDLLKNPQIWSWDGMIFCNMSFWSWIQSIITNWCKFQRLLLKVGLGCRSHLKGIELCEVFTNFWRRMLPSHSLCPNLKSQKAQKLTQRLSNLQKLILRMNYDWV